MIESEEQQPFEGDDAENLGPLGDAIAAHLALKREHGGDPEEIAREEDLALSPPQREAEPQPDVTESAEPEPQPEPESERELSEPEPQQQAESPTPEPPTPEPVAAEPEQQTGTFEFEFGKDAPKTPPPDQPPAADHDLLEDTPEFFEETPEHDKLWFDEKPPKKFDF